VPGVAISRTIDRDTGAGSVSYTAPNLKSNSALFLVESKHYGAPPHAKLLKLRLQARSNNLHQHTQRCSLAFDEIVAATARENCEARDRGAGAGSRQKHLSAGDIFCSCWHANRIFFLQVPATINLVRTLRVLQ